jgi:HSP20 family protein
MKGLTRWDPFRELSTLHSDVDELFRRTFGEIGTFGRLWREGAQYPLLECFSKDNRYYVKAYIPGVNPKEVDISVVGNRLILKGESKEDRNINEEDYLLREIRYGAFERSVTLPEEVNADEVHATFEDGMLIISAPMKEAVKTKKINVEIGKKKVKAA